jgi:hypothetical protein
VGVASHNPGSDLVPWLHAGSFSSYLPFQVFFTGAKFNGALCAIFQRHAWKPQTQ